MARPQRFVPTLWMREERKRLAGRFSLVRPLGSDRSIQILGRPDDDSSWLAITLDDRLDETRRAPAALPKGFFFIHAYRMPGHSFVMMGTADGRRTQLVHSDSELRSAQSFELPKARSPFFDGGTIWAANSAGPTGEFVIARTLSVRNPTDTAPGGFTRGAILDFVRFK